MQQLETAVTQQYAVSSVVASVTLDRGLTTARRALLQNEIPLAAPAHARQCGRYELTKPETNVCQLVDQPLIYLLTNKRQTRITYLDLTLLHSASNRLFTTQEREGTCSSEPENQKSSHLVCCVLNKILNLMKCLLTFVRILTHNKEYFLTSCLIFIYF